MGTTQKFTNSGLVDYTKLSPNNSGQRTHDIDRITPHCVVGQATVERIGQIFQPISKKASCNYGIGKDGRVALIVEEKNRSWCSSSNANDQRAITIECASDSTSPYAFNDKVYTKLILLCVDICKRYNKTKLLWIPDKATALAYNPKADEMLITVHSWFANKSCLPIDKTELLTKNGWVKLKDINIGDEVATATLDDQKIIFSPVLDKVPIKTQDVYRIRDIEATADHKILSFNQYGKIHVSYFNELFNNHNYRIPNAGYYDGKGLPLTNDDLELLIAVQADGHYMYENRIYVEGTRVRSNNVDDRKFYGLEFHLKKERKISRILSILDSLGYKPNINKKSDGSVSIRCYDKNLLDFCFKWLNDKCFTWDLIEMNPSQAKFFIENIMFWDGSLENKQYFSSEKINRDIVCAIAAINGYGALFDNTGSNTSSSVAVSIKPQVRSVTAESEIKRIPRKEVSCVTVESGFILIRQDKRTTIVGNCPGQWMMSKMDEFVKQVNIQLNGSIPTPDPGPTPSQDNAEVIWNYLINKIGNPYGVAGLMGNLYAESGLNPHNFQNSYERTLGIDDEEYTEWVDNGKYTNFIKDKAGYGLAQWTYWSRKENLYSYAKNRDMSIGDLGMQLDFLWNELQGYKVVLNTLLSANSVKEASDIVLTKYEKPANQGDSVKNARAAYGQVYFDKFAVIPTPVFKEYKVRVKASVLNYRKGPGTNYAVAGTIKDKGIYTIIDESTGKGATMWGKLKSGVGWISLDWVDKLI